MRVFFLIVFKCYGPNGLSHCHYSVNLPTSFFSASVISIIVTSDHFLQVPNKWSNDPFWRKHVLLEQVFDLTEKSLSYLIGWAGKVKLQEIEQCSKPKDSCKQLLKVAWDKLQAGTQWKICCCNKNCCN